MRLRTQPWGFRYGCGRIICVPSESRKKIEEKLTVTKNELSRAADGSLKVWAGVFVVLILNRMVYTGILLARIPGPEPAHCINNGTHPLYGVHPNHHRSI